jgi:hypothetical protein
VVSTPACDGAFHVVASPNGAGNNLLEGNSVIGVNDVWAVGISNDTSTSSRTLAEHWDGTSWSIKPTANPDTRHNQLFSVSAVLSTNVWAVGYYDINATSLNDSATLAEHWNGTSWSKAATVNPTVGANFFGVTAIAANDVWAVGRYYNFGNSSWNTLIENYNGSTWSVVSSADSSPFDYNELDTISAFSSTDIWAVGFHAPVIDGNGDLGTLQALAEHWDGFTWTIVSTPDTATGDNAILGVNALEPNHAVGVGYGDFVSGSTPQGGEAWDLTTGGSTNVVLNASSSDNGFQSVARASDGVWAAGFASASSSSPLQDLVWQANWNSGTHTLTWAASPGASDSPSSTFNVLTGIAAVSPSVFWAAGIEDTITNVDQTLAEVYCGLHLTVSAPPTAAPRSAFSVTVTAKNADASTATDYRGTIHFTSSDPQAVLPADYTFTPGDAGVHTFSGVVLMHTSIQSITVSDTITAIVTGSANVTVACVGACQSAAGTPGSRGVLPGPTPGSPGGRAVLPGPTPGSGIRVPLQPQSGAGSRLAALGGSTSIASPATSAVAATRGVNPRLSVESQPSISKTVLESVDKAPEARVAGAKAAPMGWSNSATNVEVSISLGLLALTLLALRRRRSEEDFSLHD